jgi:outer membrane beta-barrel protein
MASPATEPSQSAPATELAPSAPETSVGRRRYETAGRFELALLAGTLLNGRLTNQAHGWLSVSYAPSRTWAAELSFVAGVGTLSGLGHQAQQSVFAQPILSAAPSGALSDVAASDLPGLWQLRRALLASGRFTPVYGKLSLFSSLELRFGLFATAGVGAAWLHRESIAFCSSGPGASTGTGPRTGQQCGAWLAEDATRPALTLGVGARIWIDARFSLRLELRDVVFRDSYRTGIDRAAAEAGQPAERVSREVWDGLMNEIEGMAGLAVMF